MKANLNNTNITIRKIDSIFKVTEYPTNPFHISNNSADTLKFIQLGEKCFSFS